MMVDGSKAVREYTRPTLQMQKEKLKRKKGGKRHEFAGKVLQQIKNEDGFQI